MEKLDGKREIWVDWLRVIACLMVMVVHSTEPFYIGGDGALVLTAGDAFWSAFLDSLVRCCVPLFAVASS
jgi:surface polysaccharide O-acyltransferase-like enzyme